MQVRQILDRKGDRLITLSSRLPISEVAEILTEESIGTVLITDDDGEISGIISERDIIKAISKGGGDAVNIPAGKLMTRSLVTCTPETDLEDVLTLMSKHTIRHLPVRENGGTVGLISVRDVLDMQRDMLIQDIKKQEQTAAALQQAKDKAEIASRTKSEFLANMSHELKTPLNAIVGFSQALLDGSFGPVGSPQVKDFVQEIRDSGAHLLEIISDILDLSRIETGDRLPAEAQLNLRQTVEYCLRLIARKAEAANISATWDVSPDIYGLMADDRMIKQTLMNLLTNAIKFTPRGGTVHLTISLDDGGALNLSVSDSGIGIPRNKLETVMEPFGQADGSLSRRADGTGLGLALVASMVRLHDGKVDIASQLGQGTTVTLHFPAKRVLPAQPAQQSCTG